MSDKENIKAYLSHRHLEDVQQLDFIFSEENKILVEAAAGYGKTKSMISKIAYLILTKQVPNPKKILALTFSVNSAYKIKKDVAEQLPIILKECNIKGVNVSNRITVSNYHGFCRRILKLYGYLLHKEFREFDKFVSVGGDSPKDFGESNIDANISMQLSKWNTSIKNGDMTVVDDYNKLVIEHLILEKYITYNAILSLANKILLDNPELKAFYQAYFPIVIIDEFQDTNYLSFALIETLISATTKIYFVGDSLQKIYGFIGAMPNLMNTVAKRYEMRKIEFEKNYRFQRNPEMLLLDKNIRENARDLSNPIIAENAIIDFVLLDNQQDEAKYILRKVREICEKDKSKTVAVLFRNGYASSNLNTKQIADYFTNSKQDCFFALFTEEDAEYRPFHYECSLIFSEKLTINQNRLSKKILTELKKEISDKYKSKLTPTINALIRLLEAFFEKLYIIYKSISEEDKIILIKETFESFALRQSLEYVDAKVIFSTIHAAKGLEWDYIIIPDCEQNSLPTYQVCMDCNNGNNCKALSNKGFLDELRTFYVAFTRAKENIYFSASKTDSKGYTKNTSCILKLKGIEIKKI